MRMLLLKFAEGVAHRRPLFGIGYLKHQSSQTADGIGFKFLKTAAYPCRAPEIAHPACVIESRSIPTWRSRWMNPGHGVLGFTTHSSHPLSRLLNQNLFKSPTHFRLYKFHTSAIMKISGDDYRYYGGFDDGDSVPLFRVTVVTTIFIVVVCGFIIGDCTKQNGKEELSKKLLDEFEKPGANKLTLSLRIAECELYLDRGEEAESQQRVKDSVKEGTVVSDIIAMAQGLVDKHRYIQALILYLTFYTPLRELKKLNLTSDEILIWAISRFHDILNATKPLLKSDPATRVVAIKSGLKYLEMALSDIRSLKDADRDNMALAELVALKGMAFLNIQLRQYDTATKLCKEGLALLEIQPCRTVNHDCIYALIVNDLGTIHFELKKFSEAGQFLVKALKLREGVSDNEHPDVQEAMAIIKSNLAAARIINSGKHN